MNLSEIHDRCDHMMNPLLKNRFNGSRKDQSAVHSLWENNSFSASNFFSAKSCSTVKLEHLFAEIFTTSTKVVARLTARGQGLTLLHVGPTIVLAYLYKGAV